MLIHLAAWLRTPCVRPTSKFSAVAFGLAVVLVACGGGSDEAASEAGGGTNGAASTSGGVTIEGFAFEPDAVTVPAGTTVTWTNKDDAAHTIDPGGDLFPTSPNIPGGGGFSHTYDTAGTFPYVCGIHNYMAGTVVVS